MRIDYLWSDDLLGEEDFRAERAWHLGQLDAIHKAREFGTRFCLMRDKKLVALSDSELDELELKGRENLARLNARITEIENEKSGALVLKDAPRKTSDSGKDRC